MAKLWAKFCHLFVLHLQGILIGLEPSSPDAPVFVAERHDVLDLSDALADEGGQVLDVGARVWTLLQLQALRLVLGQQITAGGTDRDGRQVRTD